MNPPQSFEEALDEVMYEIRTLMITKQLDYGPSNIAEFGELGVLIRTNDKFARLKNLLYDNPGGEVNHESIEDTWKDICNYALIAIMVRRGIWGLPMEEHNAELKKA